MKNKGFTLIELLVVISIISLLSSIVLASINSARDRAENARIIQEAKSWINAIELYHNEYGKYPFEGVFNENDNYLIVCWGGGSNVNCNNNISFLEYKTTFQDVMSKYIDVSKNINREGIQIDTRLYLSQYTYGITDDDSSEYAHILIYLKGKVDCPNSSYQELSTNDPITTCRYYFFQRPWSP